MSILENPARNLNQLEQFSMEEWAKIPQETHANLVWNYHSWLFSAVSHTMDY